MKEQNTTYVIIAVIALIVGFVLGAWWKSATVAETPVLPKVDNVVVGTSTADTVMKPVVDDTKLPSMMVSAQAAGSKVMVGAITVPYTSWVVITEDVAGNPGRILGARRVATTDRTTEVILLRPTVKGGTYHAVIYKDNGDGVFDHKVDAAVENSSGKAIETMFKVS